MSTDPSTSSGARRAADEPTGATAASSSTATAVAEPTNAQLVSPDGAPAPAPTPSKRLGRGRVIMRRFLRNKGAVLGMVIFVILTLVSILGEVIAKQVSGWTFSSTDYDHMSEGPSAVHWFGTTSVGGDLFAQVSHGLQRSLIIAIVVSGLTSLISAFVGAFAAYMGGKVEAAILWIIHFLLVVPNFLILALIASSHAGSIAWLIGALVAFGWMSSARVIWSLSMSLREREFVTAARYMGVRNVTTVFRHMIPNIGSLLVIQFTLGIVGAVNSETGLSFLGFGIKIPEVTLGALLGYGASTVSSMPWYFLFPAAALTLLTVSMALIADGLRDALDPNSAAGGRA